jgi:hypothetical protein
MRARLDGEGEWRSTPHSFELTPGNHSLVVRGVGFEGATIPIDVGDRDLLVEVEMSRPVWEVGIAFIILGGFMAVTAIGAGIGLSLTGEELTGLALGVGMGVTALAFFGASIPMIMLDRRHESSFDVGSAPSRGQ